MKNVNLVFQGKISVGVKLRICPFSIILEVVVFWNVLLIDGNFFLCIDIFNWWVLLKKVISNSTITCF